MSRYVIVSEQSKAVNKLLQKYSEKKILISNSNLRGTFKITRYRKYAYSSEIDIEFTGQIFARDSSFGVHHWHSSNIYTERGFSKIKINKFIKRYLFNEIKNHARFFGIEMYTHDCLKKVTWI